MALEAFQGNRGNSRDISWGLRGYQRGRCRGSQGLFRGSQQISEGLSTLQGVPGGPTGILEGISDLKGLWDVLGVSWNVTQMDSHMDSRKFRGVLGSLSDVLVGLLGVPRGSQRVKSVQEVSKGIRGFFEGFGEFRVSVVFQEVSEGSKVS